MTIEAVDGAVAFVEDGTLEAVPAAVRALLSGWGLPPLLPNTLQTRMPDVSAGTVFWRKAYAAGRRIMAELRASEG